MRMSACKYCDLTVMCMSACKTLSSCITIKHCKWYAMHVNYSKPHTCMTNRQIHRAGQNHKYKVPIRLYVHKVPIRLYEYKVPIRSCIYKVPIRVFLHIQLFLPIRLFLQGLIAYTVIYGACRWFCPTLQVTQSITHLQHAHTHTLHTPCTHTPYAPAGHGPVTAWTSAPTADWPAVWERSAASQQRPQPQLLLMPSLGCVGGCVQRRRPRKK